MRAWIAVVALVCGAVAVGALPPEPPDFAFGEVRADATPERLRATALREEVVAAQEALLRRRWVDSLTLLSRGAADRPELVVVGAPRDGIDRDYLEAQLDTVAMEARAELARRGIARPAVDLGLFLIPNGNETSPSTAALRVRSRLEWYAGEAEGRAYCIVARLDPIVRLSSIRHSRWSLRERENLLGPCAFYARHGMPGAGIQRWMPGAGAGLALRSGEIPDDAPIEQAITEMGYFGLRSGWQWGDARFEACLRGSPESCRAMMLEPGTRPGDEMVALRPKLVDRGIPLLESVYGSPGSVSGVIEAGMLADLERQFGAGAFGAFWRSSQPPTVAFGQAFGASVESWVLQWARSFEGGSNLNVAPDGGETLLLILYGLLGVVLAVGVARARRVA